MNVMKWRALRFVSWLLPLLAYLVVVLMALSSQRTPDGERAYVADEAYRSLVVGRTLVEARIYGASRTETIPMLHDTLWHGLIGAVSVVIRDPSAVATLLGVLFGALTVLLLIRLCRSVFPYPFYGYFTAALLVLTPRLATLSLSGTSTPLAMCLILAAIVEHIESLSRTGKGLPKRSSLYIGLAMWLRLEFVVVWILLWVHALLMSCLPADKKPKLAISLCRGVNGILLMALLVLPIFLWNQAQPIRVPWPRLPDVPMAANDWVELGSAAAWSATVSWIGEGTTEARSLMRSEAMPPGFWARLFFALGWLLLLYQVIRTRESRVLSFFLLPPLIMPVLMGPLYPYLGGHSFALIAASMRPVMILLVSYGVVRFPFILQSFLGKKLPLLTTDRAFNVWWGGAGGILVLMTVLNLSNDVRTQRQELAQLDAHRQLISEAIDEYGLSRDRFASDELGWLVWTHRVRFMDLSTAWTPRLLMLLAAHSQLQEELLWQHIAALDAGRQPTVWLIHAEEKTSLRHGLANPQIVLQPHPIEDPDRPWLILDASLDAL